MTSYITSTSTTEEGVDVFTCCLPVCTLARTRDMGSGLIEKPARNATLGGVAKNVKIDESALAAFAIDALKQIITTGGPNEWQLHMPFAKGYVFGFVYALIQEQGVKETAAD